MPNIKIFKKLKTLIPKNINPNCFYPEQKKNRETRLRTKKQKTNFFSYKQK